MILKPEPRLTRRKITIDLYDRQARAQVHTTPEKMLRHLDIDIDIGSDIDVDELVVNFYTDLYEQK